VLAAADAAENVSHAVDPDFVESQLLHLALDALDDCAFPAALGRYGTDITKKSEHGGTVEFGAFDDLHSVYLTS
jgi:hypothetical protein